MRWRKLPRQLCQWSCRIDERCPGRVQIGLPRPCMASPGESVSYLSGGGSRLVHEQASPLPQEPPIGVPGRLRLRPRASAPASSATEATGPSHGDLRLIADERDVLSLRAEFRLLGRRYPVRPGNPFESFLAISVPGSIGNVTISPRA